MSLDRILSNFTFVIVIVVDVNIVFEIRSFPCVNRGSTFSFKLSLGGV